MPSKVDYGLTAIVSVEGTRLGAPVERLLTEVIVHNHAHLPDMVEIRLRDDGSDALASLQAKHGDAIEVASTSVGSNATETPIFKGELTSIETEYDAAAGTRLVLRGYDRAHRLTRGTKTKAYLRVAFSDIVADIAGEAGMPVEATTSRVVYEHILRLNESSWDFLQRLARENDFEVVSEQGTLKARGVGPASAAPRTGEVRQAAQPRQLVLGTNLVSLQVRVSSGGQVANVEVRGWDWKQKQVLSGRADVSTDTILGPATPARMGAPFGASSILSFGVPLESQQHADLDAAAIAERIAASSVEIVGTMVGDPDIKAGTAVSLSGAGVGFDGKYVVTSSRHLFTEDGYRTEFEVTGRMDRSLLALHGGGRPGPEPGQFLGVATAIVTNNTDSEGFGRVKVKFPWLADDVESAWARLATLDAGGGGRGSAFVPEVNDEVLVAFEHGDFRRPYVIGSLWNGIDMPPPNLVKSGEVVERGFRSRTGHRLIFNDDASAGFVEIVTAKGHTIRIDDQREKVVVNVGQSTIEMTGTGDVVIKATTITLDAQASVEIKAPTVKVNGTGQTEIKGGVVRIN